MIAAIPNIIGWLAISFATVSEHRLFDFLLCYCILCKLVRLHSVSAALVGFVILIHGKVVGRIWRWYNILHGNIEASHFFMSISHQWH
jgi:hypothetical protein